MSGFQPILILLICSVSDLRGGPEEGGTCILVFYV